MLVKILVFLLELVSLSYARLNIFNLNCSYDYKDTMVCESEDWPFNCSAYSLDLVSPHKNHFMCTFMDMDSSRNSKSLSRCGCTIKKLLMINTENYTRNLLEGGRVINTKIITALDSIKPQAPEILSVVLMENGNYNITCKTHYEHTFLYDQLQTQLKYRKIGEADAPWMNITATLPSQEIPGNVLEPSSKYIVLARLYSPLYNSQFSDWSQEVEWTARKSDTGIKRVSHQSVLPIIILTVFLIIIICASYWCWTRLKTQWWDTIPTPSNEIKCMLSGNTKSLQVFTPKLYDPWPIRPDALTIGHTVEKSWAGPVRSEWDRDVSYENVCPGQPAINSGVGIREDSETERCSCSSSQSAYRNILCPRSPGPASLGSSGCGAPSPAAPPAPSSDSCPVCTEPGLLETSSPLAHLRRELLAPDLLRGLSIMPADFEWGPRDSPPPAEGADPSCSKADTLDSLLQNTQAFGCVLPCSADDGYESLGEAIGRTAQSRANFPAHTLAPCEEGCQVLQTMVEHVEHSRLAPCEADKPAFSVHGPESCIGQVQARKGGIPGNSVISQFLPRTDSESPSHSELNTPSSLQMFVDCSYQRV
ncbi:uncharacterized protein LOC133115375 isoform X2 [Conger conger]|uniref:uncharacterized protein LOC133115375 isoform X2 n=1 Tax=Conger conger TaxID=82655 RepID=UPI002A5AF188|nr:uncharacterized protein LOC133115375 isoform X2 [Conger conger]